MAQCLKDEVRERIARAALEVFARKGFPDATMAEIARAAGVSTGNLYRYHENKEALFDASVPDAFAARFLELLRRRVEALAGPTGAGAGGECGESGECAAYRVASEDLLEYAIENRHRVIILLGRGRGTRYEGVAGEVVRELVERAIEHFRGPRPARPTPSLRFDLEQIYRNYVGTLVHILERFEDGVAIREAVGAYSRYHLAGLAAFFEA